MTDPRDIALRAAVSIALNSEPADDTIARVVANYTDLLDMLGWSLNRDSSLHEQITDIQAQLDNIENKVDTIMGIQEDINSALQGDADALAAVAARVAAVEQGLRDEISALQSANPGIDTAALEAKLADLKTTADAIDAATVAPPAPPAATPPADSPATPPTTDPNAAPPPAP